LPGFRFQPGQPLDPRDLPDLLDPADLLDALAPV